jgi:hypothetical protein
VAAVVASALFLLVASLPRYEGFADDNPPLRHSSISKGLPQG